VDIEELKTSDVTFNELIASLYKKFGQKVAVLINAYDNPINDRHKNLSKAFYDRMHKGTKAYEINKILGRFSGALANSEDMIGHVFITGTTWTFKSLISTDIHKINDISLNPKYNALCGFTESGLDLLLVADQGHTLSTYITKKFKLLV
jgi:hypothetical protein